jgi:predicted nucleotidyltransferase
VHSTTEPLGLEPKQIAYIRSAITEELKNYTKYKVFVFGSRALGKFRKYSDLDLWIEATPAVPSSKLARLRQLFSDSDLPIKVDLVTPEICLEEYKPSIDASKKLWFAVHG